MSYAQEMKNLVANIKISHKDRTADIKKIKKETQDILAAIRVELKDAAKDLKDFLAKSEETRKRDFNAMIKEIKSDVKSFLAKSEEERMANFKATMKDITEKVEEIKKPVKGMLGSYKAERKEAAGYWASVNKGGATAAEKAEKAPVASKKKN